MSSPDVLHALAVEVGLPAQQVEDVLGSAMYAQEVLLDQQKAVAYGATGVPFAVVDGRYGVPGAQPVEVFAEALRRALADRRPSLVTVGTGAARPGVAYDTFRTVPVGERIRRATPAPRTPQKHTPARREDAA